MRIATPIALLALVTVSACATPQEIEAARNAAEIEECTGLGFQPGSDAFGRCRLDLRLAKAQAAQARAIERAYDRLWWPYPYFYPGTYWRRPPYW